VNSIWAALALAVVGGITLGPIYPATSRAIMDWLPPRRRGLGMGIKQTGPSLSGTLAGVFFPPLAVAVGWRISAASSGLIVLVVLGTVLLFYRDRGRPDTAPARMDWRGMKALARNRHLHAPILWASLFVGIQFIVLTYFILFLVNEVRLSPVLAGAFVSVLHFTSVVGRVGWGFVSDTLFGGRRLVVLGILGIGTAGSLAWLSVIGETTSVAVVGALAVAVGLTSIGWMGVYTVLIGEIAGTQRTGTALGLAQVFMRMGMVTMPPLFGLLVDVTGSYTLGWRSAAALALAATLALLTLSGWPRLIARNQPSVSEQGSRPGT
jgi:ACS family hexuronate transporter-like MFS transporter